MFAGGWNKEHILEKILEQFNNDEPFVLVLVGFFYICYCFF